MKLCKQTGGNIIRTMFPPDDLRQPDYYLIIILTDEDTLPKLNFTMQMPLKPATIMHCACEAVHNKEPSSAYTCKWSSMALATSSVPC